MQFTSFRRQIFRLAATIAVLGFLFWLALGGAHAGGRTKHACKGVTRALCAFAHHYRLIVISGARRTLVCRHRRGKHRLARACRRSNHWGGRAMDVVRTARSPPWRIVLADARRKRFGIGVYCRASGHRHKHISQGGREAGRVFHVGCGRRARPLSGRPGGAS